MAPLPFAIPLLILFHESLTLFLPFSEHLSHSGEDHVFYAR